MISALLSSITSFCLSKSAIPTLHLSSSFSFLSFFFQVIFLFFMSSLICSMAFFLTLCPLAVYLHLCSFSPNQL
uniref:Uncharacterized protein n=1 Tax=Anguilla anguilla TaxID=7936 RepID=A0A0E9RSK5_ANGAN